MTPEQAAGRQAQMDEAVAEAMAWAEEFCAHIEKEIAPLKQAEQLSDRDRRKALILDRLPYRQARQLGDAGPVSRIGIRGVGRAAAAASCAGDTVGAQRSRRAVRRPWRS